MNERMTAIVGARISEFRRKMAEVRATAMSLPKEITIEVKERFDRTNRRLDALADKLRMINVISRSMFTGSLLAVSPASIPLLAGLVASLAMLGPMVGVLAGSTFALATAFGLAGAGAVAFGSMAIPTITKLFDENAELTKQQQKARDGWDKLAKTWQRIMKSIEPQILTAFSTSMTILRDVLKAIEPMFKSVADSVNNLLDSLQTSIKSEPMQEFFKFMNRNAGPMMETLGKAFGYFMQGFMNMMVAFGPLAKSTSDGFLDMSKRFADWADNLDKSKGFQSFVKYVEDNMPKIRAIFRDAIAGIVYFFGAFAPLSSDMMGGLADMMSRFKDWSKGLGNNQSFQDFIQYIRDNGPLMLDFVKQLTTFITNLIEGMAPLGAQILEIVTNFLKWANGLMETHPWLKKVFGWVIVGIGLFKLLIPLVIGLTTWFGGFWSVIKIVYKHISKLWGWVNKKLLPVFTRLYLFIMQRIIPIIGRLASVFLRFIGGPIGLLIQAVALIAYVVYKNWSEIWSATKKFFGKVGKFFSDTWDDMKDNAKDALDLVKTYASNFSDSLKDIFASIDLYGIGQDIINGLISGISSMKNKAIGAVKGVGSSIKSGFTNFFGINSPSKLMKMDVGRWITVGIAEGMGSKLRQLQSMTKQVSQVAMPQMNPLPAVEGVGVNVGAPNDYSSREETTINMAGVFEGAELTIREEADIDRIARALGERVKDRKRARGIR